MTPTALAAAHYHDWVCWLPLPPTTAGWMARHGSLQLLALLLLALLLQRNAAGGH